MVSSICKQMRGSSREAGRERKDESSIINGHGAGLSLVQNCVSSWSPIALSLLGWSAGAA